MPNSRESNNRKLFGLVVLRMIMSFLMRKSEAEEGPWHRHSPRLSRLGGELIYECDHSHKQLSDANEDCKSFIFILVSSRCI